jgi:transposase InsO family protein
MKVSVISGESQSLVRVKKYRVFKGQMARAAPNILTRDFEAAQPHEKWVTDVMEFNVGDKSCTS